MAIEPPPNIMKAGERPARVRTGAKTATKSQERDMLDKLAYLAEHPDVLIPEWTGTGRSPFTKLERKLRKASSRQGKTRRLRWMARGKHLWNGYAASLIVLAGGKVPSFASLKFQGRDVKFVYRTGARRNALIGVQHYDDPQVRLLGYLDFQHKGLYILSGDERFLAVPRGTSAPRELLVEFLRDRNVDATADGETVRCPHVTPTRWHYTYELPDVDWRTDLCMDCVKTIGGTFQDFLDTRVLGPDKRLRIERNVRGHAFTLRPDATVAPYEPLAQKAFEKAKHYAKENFISYSDLELAQWTKDELLRLLEARPEGFLLVGEELWLTDYVQAADVYGDTEVERRALGAAFRLMPPRMRVTDSSLHKILEPAWRKHGRDILGELAGGLLKDQELAEIARLNPSEALAALARIQGARERVKEFLQFDDLHPVLDFVVTCFQLHRAGERRVVAEKLNAGARDGPTRILTLSLARNLGEQANLEWQYAPHEKDAASFLDPYVREVLNATPQKFGEALTKLAAALNVPAPQTKAAPTA